jgi:murein DD-endopeptidase MepM/ murein hydrolase activator NlpD
MIVLGPLQKNQVLRGCNNSGCGSFGASRGDRIHKGIDINVIPGSDILAPYNGKLIRKGFRVYEDSRPNLLGIEIKSDEGYQSKLFYITTNLVIGSKFKKGEVIGTAQNMAQYYSDSMPNHVHIEIRNPLGNIVDFSNWFKKTSVIATLAFLSMVGFVSYKILKTK